MFGLDPETPYSKHLALQMRPRELSNSPRVSTIHSQILTHPVWSCSPHSSCRKNRRVRDRVGMRLRVSLVLAHSAPFYTVIPQVWGPEGSSDLPMVTQSVTGRTAYEWVDFIPEQPMHAEKADSLFFLSKLQRFPDFICRGRGPGPP